MKQQPSSVKPKRENRALSQDPRKLRWRRIAAKLTVREAAERAKCSAGAISLLETGRNSAKVATLIALADAYGCDITDLMPDEPSGVAA